MSEEKAWDDAALRAHVLELHKLYGDVLKAWESMPDWVDEAASSWVWEIRTAIHSLGDELDAHTLAVWLDQRPDTVVGLIAWQEAHPSSSRMRVDVAPDGRAIVTDGYAMLAVAEPVDVPEHKRAGIAGLAELLDAPPGSDTLAVTSEQVAEWIARAVEIKGVRTPALRIRDWVMDAIIAERWLSPALAIAPGPVTVDVSSDPRGPSRWTGPGWTAVVMPMFIGDDDATAAPDLAEGVA